MKKLTEFTEENAKYIAMLLGLTFSGYSKSKEEVTVEDALDVYDTGKEKVLHVHSNGKISFFVNDGGKEGFVPKEINQAPIMAYLKTEGFF